MTRPAPLALALATLAAPQTAGRTARRGDWLGDLSGTGRAACLALRLGLGARRQDGTLVHMLLWPASAAIREIEARCLGQVEF